MSSSSNTIAFRRRAFAEVISDYLSLTKPRIIVLLEITTLAAMIMAAKGWPGTTLVVVTLLGGALAAASANTINCWFDRDIDETMTRTRSRPIPSGRIAPDQALIFGTILGIGAFFLLGMATNWLAATLAISALGFYVLVYTMWLKRSSSQNIVIGGAAGAIPPLVGWAAVTGHLDVTALFLFAIIFYWTPPHFWSLALLMRQDYTQAQVPMLPVVVGEKQTLQQIVLYTAILVVVTILPFLAGSFGLLYLAAALALGFGFLGGSVQLLRKPSSKITIQLFHYSLIYLALLFAAMAADRVLLP